MLNFVIKRLTTHVAHVIKSSRTSTNSYIKQEPIYTETVKNLDKSFIYMFNDDFDAVYEKLSSKNLPKSLSKQVRDMSIDHLAYVTFLQRKEHHSNHRWKMAEIKAIEEALCFKIPNLSYEEYKMHFNNLLHVSDTFFFIKPNNNKLRLTILERLDTFIIATFNKTVFLHMVLCHAQSQISNPDIVKMLRATNHLPFDINSCSVEELALICASFFRTYNYLTEEMFLAVSKRFEQLLPEINLKDHSYSTIVKSLRYFVSIAMRPHALSLKKEMEKLIHNQPDDFHIRPFNAIQTLMFLDHFSIYDQEFIRHLFYTYINSPGKKRSKDVALLLSVLSNMNFHLNSDDKIILDKIVKITIKEQYREHPKRDKNILSILRSFIYFQIYDNKLIDYVNALLLNDSSLPSIMSAHEAIKCLMIAHIATRLESDTRIQIPPKLWLEVSESAANIMRLEATEYWFNHRTFKLKSLMYALNSSKHLHGDGVFKYKSIYQHTLPIHHKGDVVFTNCESREHNFDNKTLMPRFVKKKNANSRYVHLIYYVPSEVIEEKPLRLKGNLSFKMRLLKQLGYEIITICEEKSSYPQYIDEIATKIRAKLDG